MIHYYISVRIIENLPENHRLTLHGENSQRRN